MPRERRSSDEDEADRAGESAAHPARRVRGASGLPGDVPAELVERSHRRLRTRRAPGRGHGLPVPRRQLGTDFLVAATPPWWSMSSPLAGDEHGFGADVGTDGLVRARIDAQPSLDDDDDDQLPRPELSVASDPMYAILECPSPATVTPDGPVFTDDEWPGTCSACAGPTSSMGYGGLPPPRPRGRRNRCRRRSAEQAARRRRRASHRPTSTTSARRRTCSDGGAHANDAVTPSAAMILGPAPRRRAQRRPVSRPGRRPRGDSILIVDPPAAPARIAEGALFDEGALDVVTDLAVRHADGVARSAPASTASAAGGIGDGRRSSPPATSPAHGFLQRAMVDASPTGGLLHEHAGTRPRPTSGGSKDDVIEPLDRRRLVLDRRGQRSDPAPGGPTAATLGARRSASSSARPRTSPAAVRRP